MTLATMQFSISRFAIPSILLFTFVLVACGGADENPSAQADDQVAAPAENSMPTPELAPTTTLPGPWKSAHTGELIEVALNDLRPTQGAIGYDQIYYKLGRYELQPEKKFDDFCADEGMGGVATNGYSSESQLKNSASFICTTTDGNARDRSVLNPVVIGPNGDTLYITDGHHGLSTYYETPDGGPTLRVHVVVKDNLSEYSGAAFWQQMQSRGYTRLKDGNGQPIATSQLPAGLGLKLGLQDDPFRSLVYFTRDIGYSKPEQSTDYLEFYWADWLRRQPGGFMLDRYDLMRLGATDPDPSIADKGYLNAVWNASAQMSAATDPIIDGKTGLDLGRLDQINDGKKYSKGEFDKLRQPLTADKPGKIAYSLDYKMRHVLP